MDVKVIKPVDSTAKGAAISKYTPNRQGSESGRRQQSLYSYKPQPEKKEAGDLDRFFASTGLKPTGELSDFALLFKKIWEDNAKMQESAKAIEQFSAAAANPLESMWIWGVNGSFKQITKK